MTDQARAAATARARTHTARGVEALSAAACSSRFSSGVSVRRITSVRFDMALRIPSNGVRVPLMTHQAITVKLRLRDKHSAELNRQARAVNYVWNFCNETSRKAWSRDRRWLSRFDLQSLTAGSSRELGLHAHTIQKVCEQFTWSRDAAKRAGVRWRGKRSLGWVPFNTGHVTFDGASFCFRGATYEPMHLRDLLQQHDRLLAGSFSADSRGRWYINALIQAPCQEASDRISVGVDLGLKDLATLSDGSKIEAHRLFRASEVALGTAQRARKSKRARAIHTKVAARRRDALHKASTALAKRYGLIVIGDVSASKLARTNMAKSIHDAGWSDFKMMLSYKALMHGGRTLEVSERMSSQVCSECGSLPPSRPKGIADLGKRVWTCDDCETVHDRDVNAARNILRVGLDTLRLGAAV